MVTDWLDGRIARRGGYGTELGSLLDPIADKMLVLSALIVLLDSGVFPAWMVAAIVAREFLVTGLRLAALERGVVIRARDLGKLKTWAQATAVVLGGLAAGGAIDDTVAWWALFAALRPDLGVGPGLRARGAAGAARPPGVGRDRAARRAARRSRVTPAANHAAPIRRRDGLGGPSAAAGRARSHGARRGSARGELSKFTRRRVIARGPIDDALRVRRPLAAFACLVIRAAPARELPRAQSGAKRSWAEPADPYVVARGLMARDVVDLPPDKPLTRARSPRWSRRSAARRPASRRSAQDATRRDDGAARRAPCQGAGPARTASAASRTARAQPA